MDLLLLCKASLLLSATLLAAHLLRRARAATRHQLWTFTFAAILALPLLAVVVPALHLPLPDVGAAIANGAGRLTSRPDTVGAGLRPGQETTAAPMKAEPLVRSDSLAASLTPPESGASTPGFALPSARAALLTAWVAGSAAAATVLFLSLVRVRRLARTAQDMDDEAWTASAIALGGRLGLRRPARLLVSPAVGTPMAGGVWRPAVFLPSSAREWSAEQRDVVLAHELAHLAGHDPLRHVAARLAVAVYWFHPLAWLAAKRAVAAREQACDETVLALGTRPSAYARVLLDLAASMRPSPAGLGALSMVERSHLETRLMAILNEGTLPRRSATGAKAGVVARRGVVIPAVAVAICTLAVAAAQPGVRASEAPRAVVASAPPDSAPPVAVAPEPGRLPAIWLNASSSQAGPDSPCERVLRSARSFSGMTSTGADGRVYDLIGSSDRDRVIARSLGDVRVCMLAEGAGPRVDNERPSQWPGRVPRVILEARRGADVQRLEITAEGSGPRISWHVGGSARPFDAAAQQWRDRMLAALDTMWEYSTLRGKVSNLHGEISSLHGEESNLRGEISNLRGEMSNLQGQISNVRGEESNLRGQISSIRGQVSNLQGAMSSEQGSISNLTAGAYRLDDSAAVRDALKRHENEIAKLEREIRDYNAEAKVAAVEREIAKLNAGKQVEAIEGQIRTFDLNGKVAALEKQIAALDLDVKVDRLQKQIHALDADRRQAELEKRRDDELKRLEAAIAAIR